MHEQRKHADHGGGIVILALASTLVPQFTAGASHLDVQGGVAPLNGVSIMPRPLSLRRYLEITVHAHVRDAHGASDLRDGQADFA